jgi:hypothetical protein
MYENLYALDDPGGWYAVDERSPEPHRGEREDRMPDAARELAEAGAAYAEQPDEGRRPNPALHGDAQDGAESRVSADPETGGEPEQIPPADDGDEVPPAEQAINTEEDAG